MEGKVYFPGGSLLGHKEAWKFIRAMEGAGWFTGYPENEDGKWAVRVMAPDWGEV